MASSILLLYLTSFTEFSEIMRLPILLSHYQDHKTQAEGLSFVDFLSMHYETDVAHDDTDNELPFKGHDHSCCTPALMLPLQKLMLKDVTQTSSPDYSSFYLQHTPALRSVDIFQPPKI